MKADSGARFSRTQKKTKTAEQENKKNHNRSLQTEQPSHGLGKGENNGIKNQ